MARTKQVAVLGLGIFGSTLAESLEENGVEVLAIDKNRECVERIADNITQAAVADTTDREQLLELGIKDFDTVVVSMSKHFEESALTCLILVEMGIPNIIATARTKKKKMILEMMGVDEVINVEKDFAHKIAKTLQRNDMVDLTSLEDGYSIVEILVPNNWVGKSLIDLNVRKNHKMNVIAVVGKNGTNMDFNGDYVIEENDMLIVAAKDEVLENWDKHH